MYRDLIARPLPPDINNANMQSPNFRIVTFRNADIANANLDYVNFSYTHTTNEDLTKANVEDTMLGQAILCRTKTP